MELSDLRVFKAVAETGGISSAAKQLHRVPSNITARVQKLESELGKQLFIRDKNRLRISPDGQHLLGYATEILALSSQALAQLNHATPQGRLRIGSMEAVAASRLSHTLKDYHAQYPDVELELTTNPTGVLIDQVLAGTVDMALVADAPKDERLCINPVFTETLVLVSDLSHKAISSPHDLGTQPSLLGFSHRCAYRRRLTEWTETADIAAKVIELGSYHALLNCVTAGMGVGIVPEILLSFYPFKEDLKVHALPKDIEQTTTCIIWRKDSLRPSMEAFSNLLLEASNIQRSDRLSG